MREKAREVERDMVSVCEGVGDGVDVVEGVSRVRVWVCMREVQRRSYRSDRGGYEMVGEKGIECTHGGV